MCASQKPLKDLGVTIVNYFVENVFNEICGHVKLAGGRF
jgi:hypothetical protein